MDQRGREGGLGKAVASQRYSGFAEEVGGRTHVFLDRAEQVDELRDYERLCASGEGFVYAAMIRLMMRHLART